MTKLQDLAEEFLKGTACSFFWATKPMQAPFKERLKLKTTKAK